MKWSISAAAVLLAAGAASAKGRHSRPEPPIIAAPTELTRPAARADDKRAPDVTASDIFAGGGGEMLKAVTNSQLKVLSRLIDITRDEDPEKPDQSFIEGPSAIAVFAARLPGVRRLLFRDARAGQSESVL